MIGLHLALVSEHESKFLFKLTTDFFRDVSNLKNVKLLCNLFKINRAEVLFNQNRIVFYKEDGSSVIVNANINQIFLITRVTNTKSVLIEKVANIELHSKDKGYAHKFNREDFLKRKYTQESLDYLSNYDLDSHQITCQFRYKVKEESLVFGDIEKTINVDKLNEYSKY